MAILHTVTVAALVAKSVGVSRVGSLVMTNSGASSSTGNVVVVGGRAQGSTFGGPLGTRVVVAVFVATNGSSSNRARLTLKTIVTLLAAREDTALLLELVHADSGEGRGRVVLSSVVVDLVDRNSGVDDVRLNCLLVDDGLDRLVDVVVNVLTSDRGGNRLSVTLGALSTLVTELGGLGLETVGNISVVAVLNLAVLDSAKVVVVCLGKDLTVLDGLDRGVVVVLVDFLVNGSLHVLMAFSVDGLVGDGRGNLLVNSGVVVAGLGPAVS